MLVELNQKEEKNRKKAMIISGIIHVTLLLLAFLPLLSYPVPPPGQSGVLVSFGEPDKGAGDDMPDTQNELIEETTQEVEESEVEKSEDVSEPEVVEETEPVTEPQEETMKDVVTAEDLEAARIKKSEAEKKKKEDELKEAKREKALQEQKRKEREKQEKAAEEKRKADEKKRYEEAKKQTGDLFGKGKGSTDQSGNQGDPNGDPNSKVLEGVTTGSDTVGGGLGGRGVKKRPKITDNSQDRGTVVIKVCVDGSGNVISAVYTQKGSLSISDNLRKKSIQAAKQFKFTPSDISKQCGTITFDYKLQ